jgi:membrane carboxypeptidase/penicillin-binding protein PbpC
MKDLKECLLIFLSYFSFGISQQVFLEQPKNTSALIGSNVTLNCIVQNLEGEVTWCKDSFCTFGNRKRNQTENTSRYAIIGNETKGEFNLHIRNLTINDNASYQCQVTASEKSPALKSTITGLTVLVAPLSINISQNIKDDKANVKVILRDNTTLECIVEGANPAADINWYLNGQLIRADPEVLEISAKSEKSTNKLFKTISKLIIRAFTDLKWNDKEIKCEAINEATKMLKIDVSDVKNLQVKCNIRMLLNKKH